MKSVVEIVGRSAELEAVSGFVDGTTAARALLLRGEAGMGKTLLWQHLVRTARERGRAVLASQPTESEARLSFAALGDLVSGVPTQIGRAPGAAADRARRCPPALGFSCAGGPACDLDGIRRVAGLHITFDACRHRGRRRAVD